MEAISRVAVVEDDPEISRMVTSYMIDHGFEVASARSGRDLDRVMSSGGKIDCVILDVGLPGEDGLSICRRLRGKSTVPIIMVTGRGTDTDRIVGLELGADDYLPKPFNPRELVARVRALIRRSSGIQPQAGPPPQILGFEGWRLDMARRQLFAPDGGPRSLTSGEFNILAISASTQERSCRATICWPCCTAVRRRSLTAASMCRSAGCGARSRPPSRIRHSSRRSATAAISSRLRSRYWKNTD